MNFGFRTNLRLFLKYILEHDKGRFDGHYVEWRKKRVAAILRHYGPGFWEGKRVLEVGAGYADIGAVFARLGAAVISAEGRADNVAVMKSRNPEVTGQLADLDGKWPWTDPFDVVIHLGLLYHLKDVEQSLRFACLNARHLILETEVSDSNDPQFVSHPSECGLGYDQALHGVGSRPSPAYIERILGECGMKFQRVEDGTLDVVYLRRDLLGHIYSWPVGNSQRHGEGWRKFWFAERVS